MDLTALYVAAGVGLNALVNYIWKPWSAAYSGEKGKNFARKEDLDGILAEVRAITVTQKEIESKLSSDLWHRQMQWNQKRDLYVEILNNVQICQTRAGSIPPVVKRMEDAPDERSRGAQTKHYLAGLTEFNEAQQRLMQAFAVARIFSSKECVSAIDKYSSNMKLFSQTSPTEWSLDQVSRLRTLMNETVQAAKKDLGVE